MRQQDQISKRKEAEIERNRAIARKRIEILNELKSAGLHAEDAPLICVLPKKRHPKKLVQYAPKCSQSLVVLSTTCNKRESNAGELKQ
ncbi:protein of unknown function (plasmid) [Vibrio harveyi]|uniref:hypothetical protein n=1 Tax=Vibrio harveyi TaxID=669 RepID=UPI001EFDB1BE|nr:hypothetical protein [Vibrio harveyi]MCG9237394.1 hypothetical protein [Vibrio harveyi]MCG9589976.1 hypothetical protein [Vibrio harveyi]CAH1237715.1 protein of unknown function [Vibrio harveyi]CAH1587101.1 protein of unknown function [Vibrio harveyi]CAH1592798.1 protein of unknown function [Vibrio harveyi]